MTPDTASSSQRARAERGEVGSVEPAKTKQRAQPSKPPRQKLDPGREDNTIVPARVREQKRRTIELEPLVKPVFEKGDLPAPVAHRYNGQPGLFRRHIDYYEGSSAVRPAFRDRGDKLIAFQNDPTTVASLVSIARHRGWSSLEVRGDDVFRREVWMEAQRHGLQTKGYRPKARDREEVAKQALAKAEHTRPRAHAGPRPKSRSGQVHASTERPPAGPTTKAPRIDFNAGVRGVLLAHGSAPYRHKEGAALTPFVTLEVGATKPLEVWGVGLPAAIATSKAKVGDVLTLRRDGVDRLEVKLDGPGAPPRSVQRNRWSATAERFRVQAPVGSARDPALAAAQARLAVVETVVRAKLSNPKDQAKVIAASKARIAGRLDEGRRFSAPKVSEPKRARDQAQENTKSRGPERTRGR
jgi:hypothetical protein